MELIQKNPFRIIGLLSNTTARDLQSRKGLITRYLSIGRQLESDYDFSFLTDVLRTENVVSQAFSKIEMNQDKINQSLFWFVKANSFDETALDYLKIENPEKTYFYPRKVIFHSIKLQTGMVISASAHK